ncbi:pathogenicity island protein [Mammaliicoccus sciuri]|uniref:pathogenicity island protein n=1 Tax=Mammaliicoccus sciuri TaxID=1296 RepID=UPI00384DDFEC
MLVKEKTYDDKAKDIGLMIGIPNEIYMWTVSKNSTLYMECINELWYVWRETYDESKSVCISYKNIAQGDDFNIVLRGAKKYINYVKQLRGD